MNESTNHPRPVLPAGESSPLLGYAPPQPITKVNQAFLAVLAFIQMLDLIFGLVLLFLGGQQLVGHPGEASLGIVVLGLLFVVTGIMDGRRTEWSWRRSFELLAITGLTCTALELMSLMRLWNQSSSFYGDVPLFLFLQGALGVLNLLGAYLLCLLKHAYGADYIDVRWRKRGCVLIWVPLILLLIGGIIASKHA